MPNDNIDNAGEDAHPADSQLDGAHLSSATQHPPKQSKSPSTEPTPATKQQHEQGKSNSIGSWFSIPPPLKRLFDKFPLVTYLENTSPIQPARRNEHVLYIFTTQENAAQGRASFNPSCLKWQTCLRMAEIPFTTIPSNNHASPSGSLPFLSVAPVQAKATSESEQPVRELIHGTKLKRWIQERRIQIASPASTDVRYEAYSSLLDNSIRKAWLYQLYLNPSNAAVVKRLYTEPCSSNPFVQLTIASQLRSASTAEIVKASVQSSRWTHVDEAQLRYDADEAFAALSTLLGDEAWFFSSESGPSLFDASVFAYTHLILDSGSDGANLLMRWVDNPLGRSLGKHGNLVRHHDRIVELYY